MIFLEADRKSIANVKFLLYCFENMSGLKINYQKSEVMGIGVSEEECAEVDALLNCKRGCMPMKYLGILVSDRMLYATNLIEVGQDGKEASHLAGKTFVLRREVYFDRV
jgi:hypothetical protein